LAVAAALGFVLCLLVVGSVSLRRTRRARRRQLRTAERDLTAQLAELERENSSLREKLTHHDPPLRRPGAAAMPADLGTASMAPAAERQARILPIPADRHLEPVYEQARRAARRSRRGEWCSKAAGLDGPRPPRGS
jgi:outer membrane murein-binding lipoprotein Lpp